MLRLACCLAALFVPTLAACAIDQPPPPNVPNPIIVIVNPGAPPPPPAALIAAAAPIAPAIDGGPVHAWHFEERAGAIAEDSVGSAHGALGAGVTRVRGCAGNAVALHGDARSAINLGWAPGTFKTRDFTVSLWFRTTTTKSNSELLSNRANGSHGNFFNLRFGRGALSFELDEDTSGRSYIAMSSEPGLDDGAWHHAAARRKGTYASLFVDGVRVAVGRANAVTDIDNGQPLQIGASSVATEYDLYFEGAVDEVGIFDRALGDAEIASLASGTGGCRPGAR